MNDRRLLHLFLLLLTLFALAGCGGGGGFDAPDPPLPQVPGNLEGCVQDANGTPLSGVTVTLSTGASTLTGADGGFRFDSVSASNRLSLVAAKSGYQSVTFQNIQVNAGETRYLQVIKMTPDNATISTGFTGHVVDALYGNGLSGVIVRLRSGMNTRSGEVAYQTSTSGDGSFSFIDLPSGTYTVEINGSAFQYVTDYFNIVCTEGELLYQKFAVTPIPTEGSIRIVLTWGAVPTDLDAHLTGPKHPQDPTASQNSRFHIFWTTAYGTYTYNQIPYAKVDYDVQNSYGPETVTILTPLPNDVYRFSVHNICYATSRDPMELAHSGAVVKVYRVKNGEVLISTHNVPQEPGNLWTVFELTAGSDIQITSINMMGTEMETTNIQ